MKAEEVKKSDLLPQLRAGNLLYFKGTEYVAKVKLINAPNHFDCTDEFGSFVPNGEYEPIPITEDWLLRMGFEKALWEKNYPLYFNRNKDNYSNSISVSVHTDFSRVNVVNQSLRVLKYLHEFQNLYHALTGEELTIKE